MSAKDQFCFSAEGRCNRMDYLLSVWIFQSVVVAIVSIVAAVFKIESLLLLVIYLPLWVMGLLAGIRRLHDIDQSGWHMLWSLVPVANIFLVAWLLFAPGSSGNNRFGAPTPAQGS